MTKLNWDRVKDDEKLKGGRECNHYGETSISDQDGSLDAVSLAIAKSRKQKRKLAKQLVNPKHKSKNKLKRLRATQTKEGLAMTNKKFISRTIEFEFHYLSELLKFKRFPIIKERAAMVTFRNWFYMLQMNSSSNRLHSLLCATLKSAIKSRLFSDEYKKELRGMYHKLLSSEST
jgi:hypothetical protein